MSLTVRVPVKIHHHNTPQTYSNDTDGFPMNAPLPKALWKRWTARILHPFIQQDVSKKNGCAKTGSLLLSSLLDPSRPPKPHSRDTLGYVSAYPAVNLFPTGSRKRSPPCLTFPRSSTYRIRIHILVVRGAHRCLTCHARPSHLADSVT